MKSNKKLYIRNEEGKIQALPLYTDKNDVTVENLTVMDGSVELYAPLVKITDPHASWLQIRDKFGNRYSVYRTGTDGNPDQLEFTNDRHMLTYSGNKHAALEQALKELQAQLNDSLTEHDRSVLEKRIERAQYLVDISKFENTFYRNEFTEIPNVLITDEVTDASLMFYGCGDLQKPELIETGKFTCMQEMYAECHSLPAIFPYVIDMNSIKRVSDVSGMFENSSVKQLFVTNVRSDVLSAMVENPAATIGVDKISSCYRLTQKRYKASDVYGANFARIQTITDDLCAIEVKDATSMFEGCSALNSLPAIEMRLTKVMKRMFYGCKSLPKRFPWHINISGVEKVEDLQDMFKDSSVEEVIFIVSDDAFAAQITPEILGKPGILARHVVKLSNSNHELRVLAPETYKKMTRLEIYAELSSEITNVSHMFEDCVMLECIDTGTFDGVVGLEDTSFLFANCPSLVTAPKIETSDVKNASNMYSGDAKLTTVPYMNLKKNKSFVNLFRGCKSLPAEFPWLIDMRNVSVASALNGMFAETNVTKLGIVNLNKTIQDNLASAQLGIPSEAVIFYRSPAWLKTEYGWQSIKEIPHLAVVEPRDSLSNFNSLEHIGILDFGNVEVLASLFARSSTLKSIDEIRNTNELVSASSFFAGCNALTTLPDSLDFSGATSLNGMFSFCSALPKIPNLIAPAVKTVASIFYGCRAITTIPQLNMTNVYDMSSMCYSCTNLKELPELNTENVQVMRQAFSNCLSLPEEFPFALSLKSVKNSKDIEKLFSSSSVKTVTFKDVPEGIKSEITAELLGKTDLQINFI